MSFDTFVDAREKTKLWTPPDILNPRKKGDRAALRLFGKQGYQFVTTYEILADAIADLLHPHKNHEDKRVKVRAQIRTLGRRYGFWLVDHSERTITQIPDRDMHFRLRTERNVYLRTHPEQAKLYYGIAIAIFGQSVGSVVADCLARTGIGDELALVDFDTLSIMNMNRVQRRLSQLGTQKPAATAENITQTDPYIKLSLYSGGDSDEIIKQIFAQHNLTAILEAIDGIRGKLAIRLLAKALKLPVVMPTDVGYGTIICVERYDIEDDVVPFLGRLSASDLALLESMPVVVGDEKAGFALGIIGEDRLTPRLSASLIEFERTLSGFSQLFLAAQLASSGAGQAFQRIILGHDLPSGEYTIERLVQLNDALL
ncbi:MAG: ThiF family adenylyltransferase [Candidatus Saccharimonas sp.]